MASGSFKSKSGSRSFHIYMDIIRKTNTHNVRAKCSLSDLTIVTCEECGRSRVLDI